MLTRMTDEDWAVALDVFHACRSRRGDKGRDDRKFLEAMHYFTAHNITWRALQAEFGSWTASGSGSGGCARPACSSCSSKRWPRSAAPRIWSRRLILPWCVPTSLPPGQKGAAGPRPRALTRRLLHQDPPQE